MNASDQGAPQVTRDFLRVLHLPRRRWTEEEIALCVRTLTERLRKPGGEMTLRPKQAIALLEIATAGGLFAPIKVAGGKTLVSFLAPTVLGSKRPLLVVPAKLREKTRRAWRTLAYHWQIHPGIRIESYETISRRDVFTTWQPDVIIADEAHKLKEPRAGCTSRVRWYLEKNPACRFIDLSGSITMRSIKDYAHRVGWALRLGSPLPIDWRDLATWSNALDEKPGADGVPVSGPGALEAFVQPGQTVREGFRDRCRDTMGWVADEDSTVSIPVIGEVARLAVPPPVAAALTHLRKTWSSPDPHLDGAHACSDGCEGDSLYDTAPEVWAHARQIALGFFYRWSPAPPPEWKARRKDWHRWVRYILANNRRQLATPLEVANAVDAGHYPDASHARRAWLEIKPTYEPRTEPVWFDDFALQWCAEQLGQRPPCLLWVEHRAFAERLSGMTGVPYFSREAKDQRGRHILDHNPHEPAICSIRAIGEGLDLQTYSRNVVASIPTNGRDWEQLLGRTLREGQKADEIGLTVLSTCLEHESALSQAQADAAYIEETTGQKQILLKVDWT